MSLLDYQVSNTSKNKFEISKNSRKFPPEILGWADSREVLKMESDSSIFHALSLRAPTARVRNALFRLGLDHPPPVDHQRAESTVSALVGGRYTQRAEM